MITELIGFVLLGLSLSVPVGAITIEMVKRGLRGGFWPAWFVGLGGMSADVVLMLLIYFGIANFLTGPVAQIVLWSFGFAVLVYLGYDSIRAAFRPLDIDESTSGTSDTLLKAYASGFLIAISNPLNIVFWIGIYGSVLTTTLQSAGGAMVLLSSSFIFIGIALWDLVVAGSVHFGRGFTGKRFMKWFSAAAGGVLIAFGLSFGWQAIMGLLSL